MSKRVLLLVGAIGAGTLAAQAQLGTQPDWSAEVASIKAQPLVVVLTEEDPKELRQLANRPTELAQYKTYVAQYNAQLQQLAPRLWQFSPAVVFKSEADYQELRQAKGTKTAVLHQTRQRLGRQLNGLEADLVAWMELELVGNGDHENVWHGPSSPTVLYTSDIVFTFKNMQRDLHQKARDAGKTVSNRTGVARLMLQDVQHAQQLKTKTLLLNRAEVPDQLTVAEIARDYPFPVQVVPLPAIEAAVLAGDARYAYVRWLTVTAGLVGPSIIDEADGHRLTTVLSTKTELAKADLKDFTRYIALMDRYAQRLPELEDLAK
ncbi:MAG: hypothetical protein EOO62_19660 [Hymenobacter sp.]|nr:MAG: hypothetical protein EOO62_19660 [Hymenobacter sp.]